MQGVRVSDWSCCKAPPYINTYNSINSIFRTRHIHLNLSARSPCQQLIRQEHYLVESAKDWVCTNMPDIVPMESTLTEEINENVIGNRNLELRFVYSCWEIDGVCQKRGLRISRFESLVTTPVVVGFGGYSVYRPEEMSFASSLGFTPCFNKLDTSISREFDSLGK